MKIVTKNCSLTKGVRGYLVYLTDDNEKSLECYDVTGEEERLEKENELSEKYGITDKDIEFISLEKYKTQHSNYTPLILVFYLNEELFQMQDAIKAYGENVRQYLESKGDDVRLFFLPTKESEKITCVNPVYIEDENEFDKLNDLIQDITNKFQVGVE
jgi:hypothetical protein|tara:strand:+ start:389 stop:862 length:474 start_codon:yes stop_codon:yes gene_type:complete